MEAHHFVIETREVSEAKSARPSLIGYSPALVLLIIAVVDLQRWADPDLWGHVAFGRAMLAHHHLTMRDTYSYSAHWHVWLNHEWLSELLMGAAYNAFGIIGLKLMKFACSTAIILFLTLGLAESRASMMIQIAILLAASVAVAPQMQFRPQMFTFALMSALLALLARYTYRSVAAVWLAIPMLALWANLHGGFIIGLATLGTFTAVSFAQDVFEGRGARRGLLLTAITLASILVTLVTPYGFETWHGVAHAMTNPRTREIIDDWQPLLRAVAAMWDRNHAGAIPMLVALAMFASLAVIFSVASHRDDLPMVTVAAVMIAAAFIAMRNLPLAVIATVIPLARHASFVIQAEPISQRNWTSQSIIAGAAIVVLIETGLFSSALRAGSPKPVGAIEYMQEAGLSGNILTDFAWGEYVIWH
ncbi:MAG TPA: hypothetical protein VKV03_12000, partial [Candidatus Binataceae bacterium]|nr:hypothetical protein [Candidatus Binataceae bacterium]